MKKTLIAFFVLSVLVAACPVFAVDVSKEPTGFRGIKWDVPFKDYPNTFKPAEPPFFSLPGEVVLEKIKEKKSFAGHQVDGVHYFFDSVGFTGAMVFVRVPSGSGLSIYNDFVEACNLQWGRGRKPQDPDDFPVSYVWEFPSSMCCMLGNGDVAIVLLVRSAAGLNRSEERKRSKNKTDF